MIDLDALYEWIDSEWPVKRHPDVKTKEKDKLVTVVLCPADETRLRNKIEIEIEDGKSNPRRLPGLMSVIASVGGSTARPVYVVPSVQEPEEEQPDEVLEAFEEVLAAWPENEYKQNEKYARLAFVGACRQHSVLDVKKACVRYIEEMNDPAKASAHTMGIKRFVSDDDVLDNWLQKASFVPSTYDASFFEAAYHAYPDFTTKNDQKTKEESVSFYKRFVKEEEAVDFFCAVKAYASERKEELRAAQFRNDYDPSNDSKFNKKFVNFIRIWKSQKRESEMVSLVDFVLTKVLISRSIPYLYVYPDHSLTSAIGWNCQATNEDGTLKGVAYAVTKTVEDVCKYLTSGKNSANIAVVTDVDYSAVSETMSEIKNIVKTIPVKAKLVEGF